MMRGNQKAIRTLGTFLAIGMFSPGAAVAAEKVKVGVLLSADEARYKDGAEAAMKQLKAEGFDDSKVTIETRSANGDKKTAAAIAKEFVAGGVRAILTMGTGATGAAMGVLKETPIVFSIVWDPVEAGYAKSWEASGTNATGSSHKAPMSSVIKTLRRIGPMKRLGVLFNPAEANSVTQLADFKAIQKEFGFEVVEGPVSKNEEAVNVVKSLVTRVDALYISSAVTVTSQVPKITAIAVEHKIPTSTQVSDAADAGVLLGVTASVQEVGRLAGVKLAKVLRGEKPSGMPIDTVKRFDVSINMKTAKAAGIKVPLDLLQSATRVIR
jgi:putative tryptophan/tyrosine transport system substrate-binding protein